MTAVSRSFSRPHDYDILIAGAGAVGASLACALAGSPYRVGIIEAVPLARGQQSTHDGRGLALSQGTRQILDGIGVWYRLDDHANPIRHIHVSHRGHFGVVHLDAAELDLPALGYVVPALRLGRALLDTVTAADNIDLICPATLAALRQHTGSVQIEIEHEGEQQQLKAALLVGADGSQSRVRTLCDIGMSRKDYDQTAVVSSVRPDRPHADTAYERFTGSGPFALLPLRDGRCVSVCCLPPTDAARVMNQSDADFVATLEQRFGLRLGHFTEPGPRQAYPLRLVESERQNQGRVLLLGNSVHTLHPNAAQGFNLGLHDAAALADLLLQQQGDPGAEVCLKRYIARRRPVQRRVIRFTDSLAWLFYQSHPFIGPARSLGMLGMELLPPLKRAFARRAAGLGRSGNPEIGHG